MDYANEIIITALALTAYAAIRLVIDFLLLADKIVTKLSNYAQTVDKPPLSVPVQTNKVLTKVPTSIAPKVDKRHKYAVNVEACERYLASRAK